MGVMLGERLVMFLRRITDWWTIYTLGIDLTGVGQCVVCREKTTHKIAFV